MSMNFTKLFSSITESSIWGESDQTRLVWITMLAMADRMGRVWASVPGLAHRARVPIAATEAALGVLLAPDPYSRTPDNEGRRIEAIDGGWRILNHAKYRAMRDTESEREKKRKWAQKERQKTAVDQSRPRETRVDRGRLNAEAEAEAEAEAVLDTHIGAREKWPTLEEAVARAEIRGVTRQCAEAWWRAHDARGGADRNGVALIRWESSLIAYSQSWRANETKDRLSKPGRRPPEPKQIQETIRVPMFKVT